MKTVFFGIIKLPDSLVEFVMVIKHGSRCDPDFPALKPYAPGQIMVFMIKKKVLIEPANGFVNLAREHEDPATGRFDELKVRVVGLIEFFGAGDSRVVNQDSIRIEDVAFFVIKNFGDHSSNLVIRF
jgi:hypothetical protein